MHQLWLQLLAIGVNLWVCCDTSEQLFFKSLILYHKMGYCKTFCFYVCYQFFLYIKPISISCNQVIQYLKLDYPIAIILAWRLRPRPRVRPIAGGCRPIADGYFLFLQIFVLQIFVRLNAIKVYSIAFDTYRGIKNFYTFHKRPTPYTPFIHASQIFTILSQFTPHSP